MADGYTYPVAAGSLKKGDHAVIKGHPCRVTDISTASGKATITGVDIFTNEKLAEVSPATHCLLAPYVTTEICSLVEISEDGRLTVIDGAENTREGLSMPHDAAMARQIESLFAEGAEILLSVTCAMGKEGVVAVKRGS